MGFLIELWRFMRVRKKFWLMPVLIMMVVFGGLVVLTKGTVFGISAFYQDSAAAVVEDAALWPPRRRSASPVRSTIHHFQKMPLAIV